MGGTMANILRILISITSLYVLLNYDLSSQQYYPLEVGNRWDYEYSFGQAPVIGPFTHGTYSIFVVKDTICTNGKKYFKLSRNDIIWGYLLRYDPDSNYIYYYLPRDSTEYPVLKLNAKKTDSWQIRYNFISYYGFDSTQMFGEKIYRKFFGFDGLIGYEIAVSDYFGPVYYHTYGEPPGTADDTYNLIGCIIGGKEYGKLLKVEVSNNIPKENKLLQNYPNPFNPVTIIEYSIGADQDVQAPKKLTGAINGKAVKIIIYDILCREIICLEDGYKKPGNYSVKWNAHNSPSGIYFYSLNVDGNIVCKKMILCK
jgi:hypothetical protein